MLKKFAKILGLVTVVMVAGIIAFVVIDAAVLYIVVALANLLGVEGASQFDVTYFVLIAFILMPKRWIWNLFKLNRPYVCHASMEMDAPIEDVWDMFRLRPRSDYYAPTMPTVVAVDGKPDHFDLIVDSRFIGDGMSPARVQMRLDETIKNSYIRMTCLNTDELPLFGKDLKDTEIWMERVDGKTWVSYAENLSQLTWVAALAFLFLNPAKDGLKQVKARVEGIEDTSWMTKSMKGMGPNGEASAETVQTNVMVMVAVTIVVTVMCFGTVWLVLIIAG